MKKFTAMICAAAMSASMAITAVAAPSIGQLIPEAPELVSGEIQTGYYLDVQNVDTTKYEEKAVADIVEKFNLDDTDPAYVPVSVADILEALKDYQPKAEGQDESQPIEYKTTKGNPIVPTDYESITPFVDLVLTDGTNVEYTTEGTIKATVKVEPAKNLKAEDLRSDAGRPGYRSDLLHRDRRVRSGYRCDHRRVPGTWTVYGTGEERSDRSRCSSTD